MYDHPVRCDFADNLYCIDGPTKTRRRTISGLIEVTDSSSGVSYGYVTTDYYMGYSTVDPTENLRTVSITIPCNPNANDLVGLNVASVSPWERNTIHG
jgi:hypothetical protein